MKKFLFVLLVILVIGGVAFAGKGNMKSSGSRWDRAVDTEITDPVPSQNGRGYGRTVATEEQQNQFGKGRGNGYQNQDQTCEEFVDEDGDGVCDNCDGEGLAPQDGTGNQYGRNEDRAVRGRGTGNQGKGAYCDEFVDEDGDGVCDNCDGEGLAPQDGTGNQYGKNTSGSFSRQGGRGNTRNSRK